MKDIFTIAIVGRPNSGKSTLFNKIVKKRKAIVAKTAGVTRDFQVERVVCNAFAFNIMDTSGFDGKLSENYKKALDASDAYLFLCDGQTSLTSLDYELFQNVRKSNKPFLTAVNKIDTSYFKKHEGEFWEFLKMDYCHLSAEKGMGVNDLLISFEKKFKLSPVKHPDIPRAKVALMGRPNVGKSTLLNQLLSQERVMVSPVPGTTRDSIDSLVSYYGQNFLFIDTAGLRKKRKVVDYIEKLSQESAMMALGRAEILLLLIDAEIGPTEQDIRISNLAWEKGKGVILLINKWDLLPLEKRTNSFWQKLIWQKFRHFNKLPFLFISATEKRNITKIFDVILQTKTFYEQVIGEAKLNPLFLQWVKEVHHPLYRIEQRAYKVHFKHCRQIRNAPPVFEIKTNFPNCIKPAYDRYLKNKLRETAGFWGIPIEIVYR